MGGLHRSGTSFVASLLAAHASVAALTGTGVPEDEGQHLQDVLTPARQMGGAGGFAFSRLAHLTEQDVAPDDADRLRKAWAPYWSGAATHRVEKSPPNLLRFRYLLHAFPEAVGIAVVRSPAAVTMAMRKWNRGRPVHRLVRHWVVAHETLRSDLRESPEAATRVFVLYYENLIRSPAATLVALGEFLHLDFQGGPMAQAAGLTVDPSSNDRYLDQWAAIGKGWGARSMSRRIAVGRDSGRVASLGYDLRSGRLLEQYRVEP